jgi:hypothetical protein
MRIDLHIYDETHADDRILERLEKIMIDTAAILAAVAAERTELKSWEALSAAQSAALTKLAADLAAAIAASDPAAIAQVQADLDKAATDLNADNAEAAAAITASTPAA